MQRAQVQAWLVDRDRLHEAQQKNDVLGAAELLRTAFRTDVEPILAATRASRGGAIDPIAAYRRSGYRALCAEERPSSGSSSAGIV